MNLGPLVSSYEGKKIGYFGTKALPWHNGHLECAIKASQMVDVLFVVIGYDDEWDKALCKSTKFEWVSARVRERWVAQSLKDFPNIRVLAHYERRSNDYMNDPAIIEANDILRVKVGGKIDICFSSEPSYEEYFNLVQPGSEHVILDAERNDVNISATEIRKRGVYEMWNYLPKAVQQHYVKRVCICGVESTGKTVLTKKLAALYNTNYVEEYGRLYYEEINGCHDIFEHKDLVEIACGHNYLINQAAKVSNKVLFVDTDNIYTQAFMVEFYDRTDDTIDAIIKSEIDKIDLYIYLEPTLPHELDGMRQEKDEVVKDAENSILKHLYSHYGKDVKVISSPNDLTSIKNLVDDLIK